MSNKADDSRGAGCQRFVDELARLLIPWGVPHAAARLYGYLLLCDAPVSLDRIAADLEMSKSTASVAARLLEMYTVARRRGVRGSRGVLVEASDNYEGMLNAQHALLQSMTEVLEAGARECASGSAHARLEDMAEFYLVMRNAMQDALRQWRERART